MKYDIKYDWGRGRDSQFLAIKKAEKSQEKFPNFLREKNTHVVLNFSKKNNAKKRPIRAKNYKGHPLGGGPPNMT